MDEILNSQRQMLIRRGEPTDDVSDEKMGKMFLKHLQTVEEKLKKKSNIDVLPVHYNEFLKEPETHSKIVNQFLKISLNADNMVSVVDHSLYRHRKKS
jgi:hypothetical protein